MLGAATCSGWCPSRSRLQPEFYATAKPAAISLRRRVPVSFASRTTNLEKFVTISPRKHAEDDEPPVARIAPLARTVADPYASG
jgi:hypothetical protein